MTSCADAAASIKYREAIHEYVGEFEGVLHWNGAEILEWYLAAAKAAG